MDFKGELEARGLQGEPELIESGMIRETTHGFQLFEQYGGSIEAPLDSGGVEKSIAFLRQHRPDIVIVNDVQR